MKKTVRVVFTGLLIFMLCMLQIGAGAKELSWYCTRQKAHRQMIAAPELRFVEEYDGYYIDHRQDEKVIYLTFDAGYENGNVEKTLNVLKEKQVPAAFFVLKHFVEQNNDLARRMNEEGHLVCNHTANHPDLAGADRALIEKELRALEECCTEFEITLSPYFRPPQGRFSKDMMACVQSLGYKTVFWSFAYADWDNQKQPSTEKALRCVMDNLHNGAVLLLHPTSKTNAAILPQVIDEIRALGYRFGTLEELCQA